MEFGDMLIEMAGVSSFLRQIVRVMGYEVVHRPRGETQLSQGLFEAISATPGMITLEEAHLLHQLATSDFAGSIVEIGSYRGRSTVALAFGHDKPVYAVEPHEHFVGVLGGQFGPRDRAEFYRTMLRTGCWRNVSLVNLPSHVVAGAWETTIGLLWIDGDHRYDSVRRDWDRWRVHLSPSATVVFDDCEPSDLGPAILVRELMASGWQLAHSIGKVVALSRR